MSERHFKGPLANLLLGPPRESPPDPWPADVDEAVRRRDATPLCLHCLAPQPGHRWFCAHCGFPVGDQVMWMEYLPIFAVGEVLRRGVMGPPERHLPRTLGFLVYSGAQYGPFAPLYWYWMVGKALGRPISVARRPELRFEDDPAPTAPPPNP